MASTETQIDIGRLQGGSGNILRSTLAFEGAAAVLDLEPWIVQRLRHPLEETTAYLQLARDSGETACTPLFAVRHSEQQDGAAGSLTLASGLQQRDCRSLAMERTWQSALLGLPFGGAAYGLVCDPAECSERELNAIIQPLARQLQQHRAGLVLFPGEGCCRELVGRLAARLRGTPEVRITGTPDCMGGLDHDLFAAEGIAALVSAALRHVGRAAIGAKVAIQGFAALGRAVSQRLSREGMRVVALSDTSGAIYRPDGLIVDDVTTRFVHEPVLFAYNEAEHIKCSELMGVEADVLVLTSGVNQVNEDNRRDVAAEVIVEADFNAISEDASSSLAVRKIVVPCFVSTCGTLLGSYFEVHQVLQSRDELLSRSYGIVGQAIGTILRNQSECSCEQSAYRVAIEAMADYVRASGLDIDHKVNRQAFGFSTTSALP